MSSDAPRLAPLNGKARQLVVLVHGYGADGADLLSLGQHWQQALPDAAFASPNAPTQVPGAPGYQWFPLRTLDANDVIPGAASAAPGLEAFLEAELKAQNVAPENLVLVGFSQGAMMALHVGLRRKIAPAAVIGLSGTLVGPENLAEATARRKDGLPPPVLIMHGHMDEVIPVDAMFMTADQLAAANIPCQWHLAIGVGHGIDGEEIRHGAMFLARAFGLPTPSTRMR